MSADIIQAQYDQLEALARRFGKQADLQIALQKRVQTNATRLRTAWVGRGSDAFFAEMDGKVFPAMQRLIAALREADRVTRQMSELVHQAEDEASRLWKGNDWQVVPGPAVLPFSMEDLTGTQPIHLPSPDLPVRTRFERLLDTVWAARPMLKDIFLDKLGVGEIVDAVELLQSEQRFDEITRAEEAWEVARSQYGSDSPQALEAEKECEEAWGNFPVVGDLIKSLLDMAKANPVYSI